MKLFLRYQSVAAPAILFFVLLIAGCGSGDSGTTSTPVTTTTTTIAGPSQASIVVSVPNQAGIATGQGNLVAFDIRMVETAGLGADINFIRLEIFRATGEFVERQEIGAGALIQQTGSNRIEANSIRLLPVVFRFNATVQRGRTMRLTIGFTDDRGNNLGATFDWVF